MPTKFQRVAITSAAILVGAGGLAACGANDAQSGDGGGEGGGGSTIALLLPESSTTRYEAFDKPLFEAKVAELCDDCEVIYFNADQDEAKQTQQVDSAISQNADVIVLDPVNGAGAGGMVRTAQEADTPVIAYDRFIEGADYYLSFDNETVGRMQGEALIEATGDQGGILMLNGAPSDPNAAQFKAGAHEAIDASGLEILAEYDNPDWSPQNAQQWATDQLARFDASEIAGVYAANDGQAGGVVSALTGAGVDPTALPPITGQDAEIAAIQRILAGEQEMTIYKPIPIEAEKAAEVAVALAQGEEITDTEDYEGVASFIFDPIVVTADNVADTVIADEFYTVDQICTEDYADACAEAGLTS
ncbi:substrate-binding domain-containing protein [Nocardioides alkalitolerans]|uniref:substrate-binding domain-containing protein n=1 Tax=Nocardioides alkalitolerans TaxID=281714 RepID=UPI0003F5CABC|nr:substrate-binding domain-containing protein [Nocardioides alkalitolerans]